MAKRVSYELIEKLVHPEMYTMLADLVETHHDEIRRAKIALVWNLSWKPDVDGRCTLGKCKKTSDLDREFAAFDFVIILRRDFWWNPQVSDTQRRALLDHELCHASVTLDKFGDPKEDERGRVIYRIRKHDLEEFAEIASRYGCWKRDLEKFAVALRQGEHQQKLDLEAKKPAAVGA